MPLMSAAATVRAEIADTPDRRLDVMDVETRPMREQSVPLEFVQAILKHVSKRNLDATQLLIQNRISPRLLEEPDARISIDRFVQLQTSVMIAMEDEGLGYYLRRMPIGTWSLMCHAVVNSQTLGAALSRYCRFFNLLDIGLELTLLTDGDRAIVRFDRSSADFALDAFVGERALFKCRRFSSWLIQEHIPILVANLAHPRPSYAEEYRTMVLGCAVQFDQPHTELAFSRSYLEKKISHDDQSLRHYLRNPTKSLFANQYLQSSWTMRVKQLIRSDLQAIPEMDIVADQLHLHPQTLRRRLAEEGHSYKTIRDQLHRDTALHYLGKQGMTIEEIAFKSGFSETSTFIRAFKRWTGVTPYTFRKGL